MSNICFIKLFDIDDKIYKKINENIDKTKIYIIKEIYEEENGNWHDGYQKFLYAKFENESNPYLLAHKILGSVLYTYGVKVD